MLKSYAILNSNYCQLSKASTFVNKVSEIVHPPFQLSLQETINYLTQFLEILQQPNLLQFLITQNFEADVVLGNNFEPPSYEEINEITYLVTGGGAEQFCGNYHVQAVRVLKILMQTRQLLEMRSVNCGLQDFVSLLSPINYKTPGLETVLLLKVKFNFLIDGEQQLSIFQMEQILTKVLKLYNKLNLNEIFYYELPKEYVGNLYFAALDRLAVIICGFPDVMIAEKVLIRFRNAPEFSNDLGFVRSILKFAKP